VVAYPAIAKAFRKGAAALRSLATVFTVASEVLCAHRCPISDKTLDKLVFLQSRLE